MIYTASSEWIGIPELLLTVLIVFIIGGAWLGWSNYIYVIQLDKRLRKIE